MHLVREDFNGIFEYSHDNTTKRKIPEAMQIRNKHPTTKMRKKLATSINLNQAYKL